MPPQGGSQHPHIAPFCHHGTQLRLNRLGASLPVSVVLAHLARGSEPCMCLICQSAAMFAVKMCGLIALKEQWAEHQRLVAEHAELIAELEATLSPEQAVQVESIIEKHGRKRSNFGDGFTASEH
jgi:hypothetical protein